jgi:hypothetical protein
MSLGRIRNAFISYTIEEILRWPGEAKIYKHTILNW